MAETLSQRAERFKRLGLSLLPRGIPWARHASSAMSSVMGAFLYEYARVEEAADTFLTEMDPTATSALLDEWEAALSLPDDCGTPTTTAGRRAAIITRLTGGGTNTEQSLIDAAELFDSQTTIAGVETPTQFEVGTDGGGAGQPVGADGWANVKTLVIVTGNASLDTTSLECILDGLKRAHGWYLYEYWTPASLTGRILHLDAALGVTESGGILTAWTDQSPEAETITVVGSPPYSSADADANGRPTVDFSTIGNYVDAAGVNDADIDFIAAVYYLPSANKYLLDSDGESAQRPLIFLRSTDMLTAFDTFTPSDYATAQLQRLSVSRSDDVRFNEAVVGTASDPGTSITGVRIGSVYTGTIAGPRVAEIVLCSSRPSDAEIVYLEAYWRMKYGAVA